MPPRQQLASASQNFREMLIAAYCSFPPFGPSNVITVITVAAALYSYSERHTRASPAAERDAESGQQFIETHSLVSILRSQDGQVAFSNLVFRTNRTSSKQKEIFFNLQQVGSSENCLHSSMFSHPRQSLHQLAARTS